MSGHVLILIGTMGGTAEMTADEMAADLRKAGYTPKLLRMERATPETLSAASLAIICTSSYGLGDVPDNARNFLAALKSVRPDLSAVRFGVFALGDKRNHGSTFCFGGRTFDLLLAELGARRLVPRGQHDLHGGQYPEDQARQWLKEWLAAAAAASR